MKKYFKENWKILLFVLIGGLIGGYFAGGYLFDTLSGEALKQVQEQNITKELLRLTSMYQYGIIYGVILAAISIPISKKVNLWKKFKFDKRAVIATSIITIIGALLLFPGDKLIFGPLTRFVSDQYLAKPTVDKIIGGLLCGGIIEEVMMRLFLMSLIVFIVSKIMKIDKDKIPTGIYITANIIVALVFAAGHIPATMAMTTLTPVVLARCFILNGAFGLGFGYLYRKYGIGYAMISHGLCHLIADTLMIIFI